MVQQESEWRPTITTIILCVLAVPIAYYFNKSVNTSSPQIIAVYAVIVLSLVTFCVASITAVKDKLFYVFALFAFTSVIDFLIPLEIDGFVTNFMNVYLQHGEPYLFSAWGALSAYWDGTFNLGCYLIMAYYASNGFEYRNLAIFYASNILNSMVVLLLGAFLSYTGLHWCTLLNIPYVVLPLYVLVTALDKPQTNQKKVEPRKKHKILSAFLIVAALFNILRGVASLGSRVWVLTWYKKEVEPLLNQNIPAPFAACQGVAALFYFAPALITLAIMLMRNPNAWWLKDLSLILGGAVLQAEVGLIGSEFHPLTESGHGVPPITDILPFLLHWTAHLTTLIAPLVATRMLLRPQSDFSKKKH